jgi:hypothetical protein
MLMRPIPPILSILVLLNLVSCDTGPEELRLAAPFAQVDRAIAEDLGNLLDAGDGTHLDIDGSSLSEEAAIDAVISEAADIALVSNSLPFRDDIATVMPLYSTVLHIAYREDRDASSGRALLYGAKVSSSYSHRYRRSYSLTILIIVSLALAHRKASASDPQSMPPSC